MTDAEMDAHHRELMNMNHHLLMHILRCVYIDNSGRWAIDLNHPVFVTRSIEKEFLTAVMRSMLTPMEDHQRNGEIRHAIEDTTTGPLDEGGGP